MVHDLLLQLRTKQSLQSHKVQQSPHTVVRMLVFAIHHLGIVESDSPGRQDGAHCRPAIILDGGLIGGIGTAELATAESFYVRCGLGATIGEYRLWRQRK